MNPAVAGQPEAPRERSPGDGGYVDRAGPAQHDAGQVTALEGGTLAHMHGTLAEIGVRVGTLDDRRHAPDPLAVQVDLEPGRPYEVVAAEGADPGPGVVPLTQANLQPRMRLDALDHAGVQAHPGREEEVAVVDQSDVDPARLPVVG